MLLLAPTAGEAAGVADALEQRSETQLVGRRSLYTGQVHGHACRLVVTGMGEVNTAQALTAQLERRRPALVILFGIGGAYVPGGLPVGAVAVATEENYGHLGVLTLDGWQPADLIGIPLVPANGDAEPARFNRFPLDASLAARAVQVCAAAQVTTEPVRSGPFVTVSQCSGIQATGDELARRFSASCENMEGVAAAHLCALYGVPLLEVRAISNLVEDRDKSKWDIPLAIRVVQQCVLTIMAHLPMILGQP